MKALDSHRKQQQFLKKAGYYDGKIDGKWGKLSRNAIADYCASNGITHIRVDRDVSDDDVTISRILVNGELVCHGLEDEYRENKLPGETRIPGGTYQVGLRKAGGFHSRYSRKFSFHRGMLHVLDVPNFKYILIHVGNYDRDTDGCLLVGQADYKAMAVWHSKLAYTQLYRHVVDAAEAGMLLITYEDNDL